MVHNKNTLRILKGLENTKKNTNPNLVFKNLAYIIPLQTFRKTPNVEFLKINKVIDQLGAIDQVTHGKGAKSPMLPNDSYHYWYMHKYQKDQLELLLYFDSFLRQDSGKPKIIQLSELGLVELTRKRQGKSLSDLFVSNSYFSLRPTNNQYKKKIVALNCVVDGLFLQSFPIYSI